MSISTSAANNPPERGPTMFDVARLAGVSAMTVSRVMNGLASVRPATRDKVMEAAAALRYVPSQEARQLAGAAPIRIGFLYTLPKVRSGAYLSEVLLGLLNAMSQSNVQLIVERNTEAARLGEQTRRLIDSALDAIILPPPLGDEAAIVGQILDAGVPLGLIACGKPDARASAIGIDEHAAAYDMTRHLIALGHRRVAFVTGHPGRSVSALRLAGYRAALEDCGLQPDDELVAEGLFNYRSGLDAAERLLALAERPSAIFASNDDMAAAAVAVAQRLGLDVPGDLTVAGFDDTALATTIWPALTTVRQPTIEMAQAAVQAMLERVLAARAGKPETPRHMSVPYRLIRRQSDAAPRVRPPAAAG